MISDGDLLDEFVSEKMLIYYKRKCPEIGETEVRTRLCEMLKFLILTEHFPGNIIFGKELDDFWHLWIMQTQQYDDLCKKLPGGFFRHHSSKEYPEETWAPTYNQEAEPSPRNSASSLELIPHINKNSQVDQHNLDHDLNIDAKYLKSNDHAEFVRKAERIISFFVTYRHNFGPVRSDVIHYWPPLERLLERLDWNANGLNTFLEQQIQQVNQAEILAAQ